MKRFVFIIIVVLLLVPVIGCTSGNSADAKSFMEKIPEGAESLILVDFQALRGDDDLEDLLEEFEDMIMIGIDIDDINYAAIYGNTILLNGKFNLDDIRDELDDLGLNDDGYKDVEIWGSDYEYGWVALMGNLIILGSEDDVKDCIDVIEEGEDSLLDDSDCKDLVDRLPDGIMITYGTDEEYPDEEAWGISIKKKDDDTLKVTAIFKFKNEDAAVDAVDEIEDEMKEEEGPHNIQVDQNGEFVIASAEMHIVDWTEMLQDEEQDAAEELHTAQLAVTAACTVLALGDEDTPPETVFPLTPGILTDSGCTAISASGTPLPVEAYLIGGYASLGDRTYAIDASGLVIDTTP